MQTEIFHTTTLKKSIISLLLGFALFLSAYAGQQTERLPQQQATYRIISRESGAYYCLAINGKEYRLDDMLDMGEPALKVYEGVESYLGGSPAGKYAFPIPGSAVPRFQSSVRKDTLLIKNKKTAVFIVPTGEEINRIKWRYRSEEDFYALTDDAAYYSSKAETYLKQNGIEIVYADTTCRLLRFAGSHDVDISDTAKISNPLSEVILYNGHLPIIVPAAEAEIEAPDFFGLPLFEIVDKKADKPESATIPLRMAVPNDLDSMALLKKSMTKLEKPVSEEITVYNPVYLNGLFIGKGIPSSVKLYQNLPSVGQVKVKLFVYLRECHNDGYPALELQTFGGDGRFIDRLLVSTCIFEEGGPYRYAEWMRTAKSG